MQNKFNWLIILIALTAIECKNTETSEIDTTQHTDRYQIEGTVSDIQDGVMYLEEVDRLEGIEAQIDSALIKDGNFTFEGRIDEPRMFRIKTADSTPSSLYFILSNEQITVTGIKDSLYKAKVSGATVNAVYRDYYDNSFETVREKAGHVYAYSDSLTKGGKVKLDKVQRQEMDQKWEELSAFNDSITEVFIRTHKNSLATPLIIKERYIQYPNPEKAREFYDMLDTVSKSSYYGFKLADALKGLEAVAVNSPAPAIDNQVNLDGELIGLGDYKGKYVLVDFWASWCAPCRKENPNVKSAYDVYHPKGLEILAISLDDKKNLWEKAIEADNLPWAHVSDLKGFKNEAAQAYSVSSIPQNFLINPDGIIIATNLREEGLHTKLKEVFGEL
ncbi:TlpA disulfide reductase family protein [Leeuwenhoekiella marinoflava]|uniref:TlpA disulfide reductase family protein n=1 Tax=Leeuwenhoekiella marinoflava TaxID=988 RepID=UPI003002535E